MAVFTRRSSSRASDVAGEWVGRYEAGPGDTGTGLKVRRSGGYGAIQAASLLMASNVFFASSWVAFTWPYQFDPPALDCDAA